VNDETGALMLAAILAGIVVAAILIFVIEALITWREDRRVKRWK
jgi:hypothetical protein